MAGDQEKKSSGVLREFRLVGLLLVAIALVFGGIQIWQVAFAPFAADVAVWAEPDPIRAASTADWVLSFMEAEFSLADQESAALSLPAGTTSGTLHVKGREAGAALQDGRVQATLRIPGSRTTPFRVAPRLSGHDETSLTFQLSLRQADEFMERQAQTQFAVVDASGAPAVNLVANELNAHPQERGVYTAQVYVDQVLLALERRESHVDVFISDGQEPPLDDLALPVDWLLRDDQERRVITLDVDLRARRGEVIAQVEEPAPPEPEPTTPTPEPEPEMVAPPQPDPAEVRRQEVARLKGQLERVLRRGEWDTAEGLVGQLQAKGASGTDITMWRSTIQDGREQDARETRITDLANQIGVHLAAGDWDQAETVVGQMASFHPTEARLATWRQAVADGRAAELAAATPPPVEPTPPAVDDEALIRDTLAKYAQAQNDQDLDLLARVYPGQSAEHRRAVAAGWESMRETHYVIDVETVRVDGASAVAEFRQTVTAQPKVGAKQTAQTRLVAQLTKSDDQWLIQSLRPK